MIDRYIGPIHYCIAAPADISAAVPVDEFSSPQAGLTYRTAAVQLRPVPQLQLPDAGLTDANLCEIGVINGQEYRFFYDIRHGQKHYCVRVSDSADGILIEYESSSGSFPLDQTRFDNLLLLEKELLAADACILHSSSILFHGRTVLFTAPSGTGKSTQANLWRDNRDCLVLNGDRNIIGLQGAHVYSCGLPWHGNSPDCHNYMAQLGAIVVIRQAPEDSVVPLRTAEQFYSLYSELTVNSWNSTYVSRILDLIPRLLSGVPVFQLNCTMRSSAVDTLESHLTELWRSR